MLEIIKSLGFHFHYLIFSLENENDIYRGHPSALTMDKKTIYV